MAAAAARLNKCSFAIYGMPPAYMEFSESNQQMQPSRKTTSNLLLLEDCHFTSRAITQAFHSTLPECNVVCARTVGAAQGIGAALDVDIFMVDISLPDGNGVDFLADMAVVHQSADAIILTEGPVPDYVVEGEWLSHVQIVTKPVNRISLVRMVRDLLERRDARNSLPMVPPCL